jgi:ribose-phosphate pyrophosphokinase
MKYFINYPEDKNSKFEEFRYPAGESQVRFLPKAIEDIENADEIVVIARISDATQVIGLALLTDAIDGIFPTHLPNRTLVLPYLPYSRADRRFVKGDCFGLKTFGRLIDDLAYNRVVTLDAHSKEARKCISNLIDISPLHIIDQIYTDYLPFGTVILLPDEGAKRYHLEEYFKVFYCEKERDPKTGKILGFKVPEIDPKLPVVIIDDICDGGATFIGIATELVKNSPIREIYLYVTHGIFSKGFRELNKYFTKIFTTDSFPIHPATLCIGNAPTIIPCEGLIKDQIIPRVEVWEAACQSS